MARPDPSVDTARAPAHPRVGDGPKPKRKRLVRVSSLRGPVAPAIFRNLFPFPFGDSKPARHGHHNVFHVGAERRVGAWRRGTQLGVGKKNR